MSDDEKTRRIIESRMKLRDRFLDRMAKTPAQADDAPMGTGPKNRHGMPQLPPEQYESKKWPVLDLGLQPHIPTDKWRLVVDGKCDNRLVLDWDDFMDLEQVEDTSDFHCVTKWSRMNMVWQGVRFAELAAMAGVHDSAEHVMCYGFDGYTTNLPLVEAMKPDVLLVHTADGEPLSKEHGAPLRMITPQLYAWKGAKWIKRIEFLNEDRRGFWEERGYSNSAHPWRNDRYS